MMTPELNQKRCYTCSNKVRAWALVLTLVASGQATGADRVRSDPGRQHFLERMHPVGGWNPDGGGLLHWWNPDCFPRCGAPDDYCRKPLPKVCWPACRPPVRQGAIADR
jgi:hypothetical protein